MPNQEMLECPSCGSTNIKSDTQQRQLRLPFAPLVSVDTQVDHCLDCDFAGEFRKGDGSSLEKALSSAKKESVSVMLSRLNDVGYTMAGMERALELPAHTMMQWKANGCSAGALALLRIVTTYPWAIDVADAQFDPAFAKRKAVEEGVKALCNLAEANNIWAKISVLSAKPYETFGTFQFKHMVQPMIESNAPSASTKMTLTAA
jgi:hypothetical protein